MKALSIKQPWAWAIVHGYKPVENRSWATAYRGPLLIHTGQEPIAEHWRVVRMLMERDGRDPSDLPDTLPLGGIVGEAVLTGCVTSHDSIWFQGPFGLVLTRPRPLKLVPCPGRLSLFDVPDHVLAALPDAAAAMAAIAGARLL
ncbi:MAG: ASCH domain-containing protein [Rhodospirillaceae bacterium]